MTLEDFDIQGLRQSNTSPNWRIHCIQCSSDSIFSFPFFYQEGKKIMSSIITFLVPCIIRCIRCSSNFHFQFSFFYQEAKIMSSIVAFLVTCISVTCFCSRNYIHVYFSLMSYFILLVLFGILDLSCSFPVSLITTIEIFFYFHLIFFIFIFIFQLFVKKKARCLSC